MGQLKNITNISAATAVGLGIDTLTGWTRVLAPADDLPTGSVSTAYLCQTNDASTATVQLDAAAAVFSGGNQYHRVSFMVRLIKTDNEVGTAPSAATLFDLTDDTGAYAYRAKGTLTWAPPSSSSPDLSRHTPELGAVCLWMNTNASVGTDGVFNPTECGKFRNSSGSATSPGSGAYLGNFPIGQWKRIDLLWDRTNKRMFMLIDGFLSGFYSFGSAVATPSTSWLFTFPAWTGFRWHLCEMSSWADATPDLDTQLAARTDTRNWRSWALLPGFLPVTDLALPGIPRLVKAANTMNTVEILPYSLVNGTRPMRERLRLTASTAGVKTYTFLGVNLPLVFDDEGIFHLSTAIRLGAASSANSVGQAWTVSMQFTGISPSLSIAYSSGKYRLTDAGGNEIANWDVNELVQLVLTISRGGSCWATVYNQSKDSTASSPFSAPVALAASDAVPTGSTGTLTVSFSCTGDGVNNGYAEMEALEGYRTLGMLIVDSYTEAALPGTSAYTVSTFTSAYRATINRHSLQQISDGSADCNVHGGATYPMGPNFPRWAFAWTAGRSGKKMTDWATYNVGRLNYLKNSVVVCLGGFANDLDGVTDLAGAQAAATTLATAFTNVARDAVQSGRKFVWIRPSFPPYVPNLSYPISPLAGQYPLVGFRLAFTAVTNALQTLRNSLGPRGSRIIMADIGSVDFADGLHLGADGTAPAFINAAPQVSFQMGQSYAESSNTANAYPSLGGTSRKRILPAQP